MVVSPEQIRAARALLRIEQAELAARANVSLVTIRRAEGSTGHEHVAPSTVASIQQILEQSGAEFIPNGVRRRPVPPRDAALFDDLRAISVASAAQLRGRTLLMDADLYDEHGLPA